MYEQLTICFHTKRCGSCDERMPATTDFFHRKNTAKDGLRSDCKECRCKKKRESKSTATYNAEYRRKRYAANPKWRDVYDNTPYVRNWRASLRQATGRHTSSEVQQMYRDQGGLCAYCDAQLEGRFDVDHMVPLSRGGSNDWENLAVACPPCNRGKHTRTAEEFMALRR